MRLADPRSMPSAYGFDEAAALLFDVRIRRARGQSARSRPSVPSSSAPITGANTPLHQPQGSPGEPGVRRELAVRAPWRSLHRQARI